jgi:hypothetical protein
MPASLATSVPLDDQDAADSMFDRLWDVVRGARSGGKRKARVKRSWAEHTATRSREEGTTFLQAAELMCRDWISREAHAADAVPTKRACAVLAPLAQAIVAGFKTVELKTRMSDAQLLENAMFYVYASAATAATKQFEPHQDVTDKFGGGHPGCVVGTAVGGKPYELADGDATEEMARATGLTLAALRTAVRGGRRFAVPLQAAAAFAVPMPASSFAAADKNGNKRPCAWWFGTDATAEPQRCKRSR